MAQGQLTDGTVFGSTYETGDPIDFELGSEDVIQGDHDTTICFVYAVIHVSDTVNLKP